MMKLDEVFDGSRVVYDAGGKVLGFGMYIEIYLGVMKEC
jgi:hypothetical protein